MIGRVDPFFWNWPEEYQEDIRDREPHYLSGKFSRFRTPQCKVGNPVQHELM